nr:photosystem II protein M [Christella acuminata]YP_010627365.1 photosystem II protein M [Christella latipinna]YP_010627434.1 photosystem II protein M [Christella parasitica]YP_010627503.1 photosystem II protein M [Cyclosorus aridus]WBK27182.1 photosystem II protein M [Christella acuminata]WBK27251.1 photosystem II protein M [Christella latipinna]WBK27320.1 photosystem II protein M [Christella parasitica]WBK27389.1 photosystem II protein M [Cyclosorus aridus]
MNYQYGSKYSCVRSHRTFYSNPNSFSTYSLHPNGRSE